MRKERIEQLKEELYKLEDEEYQDSLKEYSHMVGKYYLLNDEYTFYITKVNSVGKEIIYVDGKRILIKDYIDFCWDDSYNIVIDLGPLKEITKEEFNQFFNKAVNLAKTNLL